VTLPPPDRRPERTGTHANSTQMQGPRFERPQAVVSWPLFRKTDEPLRVLPPTTRAV